MFLLRDYLSRHHRQTELDRRQSSSSRSIPIDGNLHTCTTEDGFDARWEFIGIDVVIVHTLSWNVLNAPSDALHSLNMLNKTTLKLPPDIFELREFRAQIGAELSTVLLIHRLLDNIPCGDSSVNNQKNLQSAECSLMHCALLLCHSIRFLLLLHCPADIPVSLFHPPPN